MFFNFFSQLSQPDGLNLLLLSLFKYLLIASSILYIIFSFVILRQIKVMKDTLITSFTPTVRLLGLIHLTLAFGVMFFYIISL